MPTERMKIRLNGAAPASPAALAIGLLPANAELNGLGTILVTPLIVLPATTDIEGKVTFTVWLPQDPNLRHATIFTQAVFVSGGVGRLSDAVASRVCP